MTSFAWPIGCLARENLLEPPQNRGGRRPGAPIRDYTGLLRPPSPSAGSTAGVAFARRELVERTRPRRGPLHPVLADDQPPQERGLQRPGPGRVGARRRVEREKGGE